MSRCKGEERDIPGGPAAVEDDSLPVHAEPTTHHRPEEDKSGVPELQSPTSLPC